MYCKDACFLMYIVNSKDSFTCYQEEFEDTNWGNQNPYIEEGNIS